jgi:hypothetical protein
MDSGVGKAAWDMAAKNPELARSALNMAAQAQQVSSNLMGGSQDPVHPNQPAYQQNPQPNMGHGVYQQPGGAQNQQQNTVPVTPPTARDVQHYTGSGPENYTIDGITAWLAVTDIYPNNPSGKPRKSSRWLPDADADNFCPLTGLEFDWVRRKHHCRLCGGVFAEEVCSNRAMLAPDLIVPQPAPKMPGEKNTGLVKYVEINHRDPQRVCDPCYEAVQVFQEELSSRECNALQQGAELDEDSMVRFMNSPVSFSLEQEIKKAAYTISNITVQRWFD